MIMTLSVNHQLMLLHDILDEHHLDHSASVAEHQQIKRIVQTILANNSISDEQLLELLPEIYNYGQKGESSRNQPDHITSQDRKSTRLNSSHVSISYAVFCF